MLFKYIRIHVCSLIIRWIEEGGGLKKDKNVDPRLHCNGALVLTHTIHNRFRPRGTWGKKIQIMLIRLNGCLVSCASDVGNMHRENVN